MSRIGKSPIAIPSGVEVTVKDNHVTVKGSKGTLEQTFDHDVISVSVEDGHVSLTRANDEPSVRAKHGLYRSLIHNMVIGVSEGYKKQLEVVGVGFRATVTGQILDMSLGFSHPVVIELPQEIKASAETAKGKAPVLTLESHDKQLLGQVIAKIRSLRKPEPYKGKGIKFVGEEIRRKAGKSAAKK